MRINKKIELATSIVGFLFILHAVVLPTRALGLTPSEICAEPAGTTEYKSGYSFSCPRGITGEFANDFDNGNIFVVLCKGSNSPGLAGNRLTEWQNGCEEGYRKGDEAFRQSEQDLTAKLTTRGLSLQSLEDACSDAESKAANPTSGSGIPTSQLTYYYDGCLAGYKLQAKEDLTSSSNHCNGPQVVENRGCTKGIELGYEQYRRWLPLVAPIPDSNTNSKASTWGCAPLPTTGAFALGGDFLTERGYGYIQGCVNAYKKHDDAIRNNFAVVAALLCTETELFDAYPMYNSTGYRQGEYNRGYTEGCNYGNTIGHRAWNCGRPGMANDPACDACNRPGLSDSQKAQCRSNRANRQILEGGIVPQCDPSLPPGGPARADGIPPCGTTQLVELLKRIMSYLWMIALPIGALMLGWGGFNIMTAAGSEEKITTGRTAIKVTVIGYAIMLASYLVIKTIFTILGAKSGITSTLF